MQLQSLIRETMGNPPELFYKSGVHCKNTIEQYLKIKSFLYQNHYSQKPIGLLLEKDISYFLCMLACMDLGVAYVPMKDTFPEKRVLEIAKDVDFEVILDNRLMDEIQNQKIVENFEYKKINKNSPLYIIFTSGSTGRPKGVEISHEAFEAYANWLCEYQKHINEKDRVLQITDFTFDISLIDLILFLYKKTSLYFSNFEGNIFTLASELEVYHITTISTVPNNINMLLEDKIISKINIDKLETLMIGGARFSHGLYNKVCKSLKNKDISNFYGPTECTIYSHAHRIKFSKDKDLIDSNITIGVENSEVISIIYKDEKELAEGEQGELLIGGTQLMNGYKNNLQKTEEVFVKIKEVLFYKTGDIAFKKNEKLYIVGRLDETIKYKGYRINLLDIESYIMKLEYIDDVATIAIPDEISENKTICFLKSNKEIDISELKKELKTILLDYQIPEEFYQIETFPTNISGKVCKIQLTEIYNKMK